jgi:glycosyltransferase 2 family protein
MNRLLKSLIKPSFLLRLAVTIAILYAILHALDIQQIIQILREADPNMLLLAIAFQFGSTAVSAYRWQLIMQNLHFGQNFRFYWQSYFKGMFFNQGLPTSVGGDAVRVLDVAKKGFRKRDVLYGVMVDRVVGLGALLCLSLFAYLIKPHLLPLQVYRPLLLLVSAGLGGFLLLFIVGKSGWLRRYPALGLFHIITDRLYSIFHTRRILLVGLSLLIPLLAMLGFYATGKAFGLDFDLLVYMAIVPLAIVLTVIPVSIAGWGVREGALVWLFSLLGANKTIVLAMSLFYGLTLIVVSLPGLVVFLKGLQSKKGSPHA